MNLRLLTAAAAAFATMAAAVPAQAAPIKVNVRVEGETRTLFEGNVMTDAHAVTGDQTGPHKCDGTNGGAHPSAGPTLTGALDHAMHKAGIPWSGTWNQSFEDFLIERIGPDAATSSRFWGTAVNFRDTDVGGCQQRVVEREQLLIAYDSFGKTKLRLAGPKRVDAGDLLSLFVLDGADPSERIKGARVGGRTTGGSGRVRIRMKRPGLFRFKATKDGTVRSNQLRVRVVRDAD